MKYSKKSLNELISNLLEFKRKSILKALKLEPIAKKPKISYGNFKLAALALLKKKAKGKFKKSLKFYKRFTFSANLTPKEKLDLLKSRLKQFHQQIRIKRLIYIYWGYKEKKRICIYVGQTKGYGDRTWQHPEFFRKYDVTMIKLYRVKKGKRYLDATECYGIHAYAPLGKRYPPENEKRPDKKSKRGYFRCRICEYIRKGWKQAKTLLK